MGRMVREPGDVDPVPSRAQSDARRRPALAACLLIATTGEVILSLVWGLYTYRLDNIPLFVPRTRAGLLSGTQWARAPPERGEWWIAALAFPW